jgi:methyltransferase
MVALHTLFFVASGLEVVVWQRPFFPLLGWAMLALLICCLAGRIWIWRCLGEQWNTQIVIASRPIVDTGPYRYVRHPNYAIVIVEMFALPLVHSAYLTALVCSLLNGVVLWQRIRYEEAALFTHPDYVRKMGAKPRFFPCGMKG